MIPSISSYFCGLMLMYNYYAFSVSRNISFADAVCKQLGHRGGHPICCNSYGRISWGAHVVSKVKMCGMIFFSLL